MREEEGAVLQKLTESLRKEVLVHSNAKILSQFPAFTDNFSRESLQKICQVLKPKHLAPQEILFQVKYVYLYQ